MANEVTIKIRAFPYYTDAEDPVTGKTVRQERIATRGETVELNDLDFERAKRLDAIQTDADQALSESDATGDDVLDAATSPIEDLVRWIQEDKPTVAEVVAAADDDRATAERLLQAESTATGGDSRKGVVEGLTAIINEDEEEDEDA